MFGGRWVSVLLMGHASYKKTFHTKPQGREKWENIIPITYAEKDDTKKSTKTVK